MKKLVPQKKVITIKLQRIGPEIDALGIVEDKTVFRDVRFTSISEAFERLTRALRAGHRVIFNIHPSCKETH